MEWTIRLKFSPLQRQLNIEILEYTYTQNDGALRENKNNREAHTTVHLNAVLTLVISLPLPRETYSFVNKSQLPRGRARE